MSEDQHKNPDKEENFKIEQGPHDSSLQPGDTEPDERLDLPKGAFVAMRKSGGLKFSTRTLVVYTDGHALYTAGPGSTSVSQSAAVELSEMQLARLRRTLAAIDFAKLPPRAGRASPDGFVYEITAHVLKSYYCEAWDGSIPQALKPLIEQLRRLMPAD
ncbi:MAG: hypothetical protein WCF84_17465 [Anaerolineae bacterium]